MVTLGDDLPVLTDDERSRAVTCYVTIWGQWIKASPMFPIDLSTTPTPACGEVTTVTTDASMTTVRNYVRKHYPGESQATVERDGLAFATGWKCLDGAALTLDDEGQRFATLEATRAHARLAPYNNGDPLTAGGLGRRVFLVDGKGRIVKSVARIRLGPDYIPEATKTAKNPQGHGTGWGLY